MNTPSIKSVKIEEATALLVDHVFYDIRNKMYVAFANGVATFIPECFMPTETLIGIKSQINCVLKERKASLQKDTIQSSTTKEVVSNNNTNIRSIDETNLEKLKNSGVVLRKRKDLCLTLQEVEVYTLYNRIQQRKKRINKNTPSFFGS